MRRFVTIFLCLSLSVSAKAQFPPAAGQPGSTAIHADSSCFTEWAVSCLIERGYLNMTDTVLEINGSHFASYGTESDAVGKADNTVVSLGDKGNAVLTFEFPVVNGPGWDFAVFENALTDTFLELAFVEVSSDGAHYFRFPAVSLTSTDMQTGSFGETDPTKIHNLAGKYRTMYGTPFDLDEIPDDPALDKNHITHIRIVDVGGSVNPLYASYDHSGAIINDPFPTPFESCGFDLDAVGVIHNTQTGVPKFNGNTLRIFPNPVEERLCIFQMYDLPGEISIFSVDGRKFEGIITDGNCADVSFLSPGLYLIRITGTSGDVSTAQFVKQ